MKKVNLLLSLIAITALSGCRFLDDFFNKETTPTENNGQDDTPIDEEKPQTEEKKQIGEFFGGLVNDGKYIGYEFSKSKSDLVKPTTGIGDINVYSFNDFHGAVLESESETGLKRLGTFFKEKSQEANTLILDQGDTWQGSLESNYHYGAIVQDVFNYAGVSLRTLGNHDFDWGLNHLEETNNRKLGDDYIPCLGANVFDYHNGKNGTSQQSKYGKEYAIFTLDNGIKVGVVGVIGSDQITSICSQLVDTICFTNHVQKIKEISDYLRTEKNCDVIIASTHESTADMYGTGLERVSPKSNKRYADLVLSGHAHYKQDEEKGGVKYVQWDSNGDSAGLISLKYDFATNTVVDSSTTVNTYYSNYFKTYYPTIDPTIETMVDDYLQDVDSIANEVLSTNFTGYWSTTDLGNLMSEAIYYSAKSLGKTVDFAVCNYARTTFSENEITFSDLYKCFPFDNEIILMDVSSYESCRSISHNESYREDTSKTPIYGNNYHIAVIDYIGLHQDSSRDYDYFPDATNLEILKDGNNEPLIYRNILKDYLKDNQTKIFDANDYSSNNPHFNF